MNHWVKGPASPSRSHKSYVTTLKMTDVRLMCVPLSQISKRKRNHFLTSKKCFKTLKYEIFAGAGLASGPAEWFWGMEWRLSFQNMWFVLQWETLLAKQVQIVKSLHYDILRLATLFPVFKSAYFCS